MQKDDKQWQLINGNKFFQLQLPMNRRRTESILIDIPTVLLQKLLSLTEPVSHLDLKYQHQLLQQAKLISKNQVAVVAVWHDVNLALKYADTLYFMKEGRTIHKISQNQTITADLLKEVFDVEANIIDMPDGSGKFVSY